MPKPLTIIICFLLVILLGLGIFWPKYQNLKTLEQEIRQKKAELQSKEEYSLNLQELSAELKKYPDSLSKIKSILPSKPSLPALFDFLEKTSSQSGLILKGISPVTTQPFKEGSDLKKHSLSLSLSGSYFAFKNFLSALEKSARFIETESISISVLEGKPLLLSLKIKFYSY